MAIADIEMHGFFASCNRLRLSLAYASGRIAFNTRVACRAIVLPFPINVADLRIVTGTAFCSCRTRGFALPLITAFTGSTGFAQRNPSPAGAAYFWPLPGTTYGSDGALPFANSADAGQFDTGCFVLPLPCRIARLRNACRTTFLIRQAGRAFSVDTADHARRGGRPFSFGVTLLSGGCVFASLLLGFTCPDACYHVGITRHSGAPRADVFPLRRGIASLRRIVETSPIPRDAVARTSFAFLSGIARRSAFPNSFGIAVLRRISQTPFTRRTFTLTNGRYASGFKTRRSDLPLPVHSTELRRVLLAAEFPGNTGGASVSIARVDACFFVLPLSIGATALERLFILAILFAWRAYANAFHRVGIARRLDANAIHIVLPLPVLVACLSLFFIIRATFALRRTRLDAFTGLALFICRATWQVFPISRGIACLRRDSEASLSRSALATTFIFCRTRIHGAGLTFTNLVHPRTKISTRVKYVSITTRLAWLTTTYPLETRIFTRGFEDPMPAFVA